MLNVIKPNVAIMIVVLLRVVILSDFMLNAIMQSLAVSLFIGSLCCSYAACRCYKTFFSVIYEFS
jgi:hypothetical protein